MRRGRKLGIFGFLCALVLCSSLPAAIATTTNPIRDGLQHSLPAAADLLSPPPPDHAARVEATNLPSDTAGLLASTGTSANSADTTGPSEVADAARHRNMAKFLLVILILGSVIRFVTSRAYLEFIADVLDPKAF
jgi:hypothetical protein